MGPPCFPQPNLWLARCASMSWTALKKFVVLSTHELRTGKNIHSIAGGKRGRFCRCSVCAVCCVCSVLRRLAVCAVLRDGDGGDGEHSDTTALCDRNVSFQPARNIPSLCWGLPPNARNARNARSSKEQQGAARNSNNRQAVGEQQVSSR